MDRLEKTINIAGAFIFGVLGLAALGGVLFAGATHQWVMRSFTQEQQDTFMAQHGKTLSRMIALTICRGFISGKLLTPIVALLIREFVDVRFILAAHKTYLSLLGAKSFSDIIRSAEELNPMRPTLSHKRKGS